MLLFPSSFPINMVIHNCTMHENLISFSTHTADFEHQIHESHPLCQCHQQNHLHHHGFLHYCHFHFLLGYCQMWQWIFFTSMLIFIASFFFLIQTLLNNLVPASIVIINATVNATPAHAVAISSFKFNIPQVKQHFGPPRRSNHKLSLIN